MSSPSQSAAIDFTPGRVLTFTPRRLTGQNVFIAVWLAAWIVGNAVFLGGLVSSDESVDPAEGWELLLAILFFSVWVLLWGGGGVAAAVVLAFNVAGRETASIVNARLVLRRSVGRAGRTNVYELAAIRDLRTLQSYGVGHQVVVSYERQTVRFGRGLDAAAADGIADVLREQRPSQDPIAPPERSLKKIEFTGSALELRSGGTRVGWTRRFDRAFIRDVRATPVVGEDGPSDEDFEIAFEYRGKTIRFGGKLRPGEAEALARHMREELLVNVI
jgi:hypothetical protein